MGVLDSHGTASGVVKFISGGADRALELLSGTFKGAILVLTYKNKNKTMFQVTISPLGQLRSSADCISGVSDWLLAGIFLIRVFLIGSSQEYSSFGCF